MGGVTNALGPSPTLGSLGPSHEWRHKSWASLWGPPCAHGIAGTPQREVRDTVYYPDAPTLSQDVGLGHLQVIGILLIFAACIIPVISRIVTALPLTGVRWQILVLLLLVCCRSVSDPHAGARISYLRPLGFQPCRHDLIKIHILIARA